MCVCLLCALCVLQCEATQFSQLTFFPDRPDILSHWRVRLEADEVTCPVLISNGNVTEEGRLPGGRHFSIWEVSCSAAVAALAGAMVSILLATASPAIAGLYSSVQNDLPCMLITEAGFL